MHPLTGAGTCVFPNPLTLDRPLSNTGVLSALRRMGFGKDEMTGHGFRATARTIAHERLGIAPEVIEAQLTHKVPDALGRAYNRTLFLEQRRGLLTRCETGANSSNTQTRACLSGADTWRGEVAPCGPGHTFVCRFAA